MRYQTPVASRLHLPALSSSSPSVAFKHVWIAALPASILVAICLCFHLPNAFTIDDTIFLRIAEQAIQTPTRPLAFDMCWDGEGKTRRFSEYIAHAPLMGYLLMPVVRSGRPEIEGHLLQLILLIVAIFATASLALRLGLRIWGAMVSAILVGTCPAVLGMAATVMPDVAAMALAVLGTERFVAWRQSGVWSNAIIATIALALAPLARPQTILIFAVCLLFAIPEISLPKSAFMLRQLPPALVLVTISASIYVGLALITKDPGASGFVLHRELVRPSPSWMLARAYSLGCYLSLTTPFVVGVLAFIFPFRRRSAIFLSAPLPAFLAALSPRDPWLLIISGGAYFALGWVTLELCKIRTGPALALALWSMLPVTTVSYLHMSAKYLVPAVPAYALLLALLGRRAGTKALWLYGTLVAGGAILGLLIIAGDARMANLSRTAVDKWLPSLMFRGERVLFQGQWGLQWYAEKYHAVCFDPKVAGAARPGDWVIVGIKESGHQFPRNLYPASRLVDVIADPNPGGIVLDYKRNVGFFSDFFGRLPWLWATSDTLRYELWQVQ